jgi:hypothetical protein
MISVPAKMICSKNLLCALALITAVFGDQAHAESNLDASYTISFARIRVGEITASVVFGPTEYAMSASGRAGGLMRALVDGEGSFTARGPITDDHPVPTNFTSKIVANGQTSDVTMVLDEGSVKELAARPLSSSDRVPVTEATDSDLPWCLATGGGTPPDRRICRCGGCTASCGNARARAGQSPC